MLDITRGPQRRSRIRRKWLRIVRNLLILLVVAALLFVAAKFAYRWYLEVNNGSPVSVTYKKSSAEKTAPEPVMSATEGPMTTIVRQITSPVAPSDSATITLSTSPKALCAIQVEYPQDRLAQDAKLAPKIADATGKVTWAWIVRADTTTGTGTATVTCATKGNSTHVMANLIIANKTMATN